MGEQQGDEPEKTHLGPVQLRRSPCQMHGILMRKARLLQCGQVRRLELIRSRRRVRNCVSLRFEVPRPSSKFMGSCEGIVVVRLDEEAEA